MVKPTAVHLVDCMHSTSLSTIMPPPGGFGPGYRVPHAPREGLSADPTAARSPPFLPGGSGTAWIVQDEPSQASTRGWFFEPSNQEPTAKHAAAPVHAIDQNSVQVDPC